MRLLFLNDITPNLSVCCVYSYAYTDCFPKDGSVDTDIYVFGQLPIGSLSLHHIFVSI